MGIGMPYGTGCTGTSTLFMYRYWCSGFCDLSVFVSKDFKNSRTLKGKALLGPGTPIGCGGICGGAGWPGAIPHHGYRGSR